MSGMLDQAEVELPCPGCGSKTKKTIGWINSHNEFTCTCGKVINLKADQFREGIREAEASIQKFQDAIKGLGKGT